MTWAFETLKPTPSDTPPSRSHLSKQLHKDRLNTEMYAPKCTILRPLHLQARRLTPNWRYVYTVPVEAWEYSLLGAHLSNIFLRIYLFIMYTVFCLHVYLQASRGHHISLQVVVSHHVVAGNWTHGLWQSSQCSQLLSHSPTPYLTFTKPRFSTKHCKTKSEKGKASQTSTPLF